MEHWSLRDWSAGWKMKMVTGLASPHKNTWPPSQASPSSSRRPMALSTTSFWNKRPKPWTETFIDWLIITDYILCILNIVMMTLMSALKFVMLEEIQVCHFSPITPIVYYLGMEDNRQDGDDRHCISCINKHIFKCKERRLGSMLGLVLKC